jgi:hypothetical protein
VAAGFVDVANAGNGQSSTVSSITITVPSTAAAGNYAVIDVWANSTTAALNGPGTGGAPTGWSVLAGPVNGDGQDSLWLLGKTLVSGDVGANVTVSINQTKRLIASMQVGSGVTATGMQVATRAESSYTTSPTMPSVTGVGTGSLVLGFMSRHGSVVATLGLPSAFASSVACQTAYSGSPQVEMLGGWYVTTGTGTVGGTTGSSAPNSIGVNALVVLPASTTAGSGATVTGVAIAVSLAMPAGTASGTAASPTTAVSTYEQVWRSGGMTVYYSVKVSTAGVPVQGAQDLRPVGGQIVDTNKPGGRRLLTLDLAPELIGGSPIYELLTPAGTRLTVTAHCSAGSVPIVDVPMGVFDVDSAHVQ